MRGLVASFKLFDASSYFIAEYYASSFDGARLLSRVWSAFPYAAVSQTTHAHAEPSR